MGSSFKCFGAAPLENIVKNRKNIIMEDLENALAQQAPAIQHINPDLHELPPLVCCVIYRVFINGKKYYSNLFITHKQPTGNRNPFQL